MTTLVLLINLGTPSAPTPKAVRQYLAEFLSDPRVVELPAFLWKIILYSVILPFRSKKTAHAYQKIWSNAGSPLLVGTKQCAEKLQALLPEKMLVDVAMRYNTPSIEHVLMHWKNKVSDVIVVPLYPQYASATTGSSLEEVFRVVSSWRVIPNIKCISDYYAHPAYIEALALSIEDFWQKNGRAEYLMLSYHGLPERSIALGEPYFSHCQRTTALLVERLKLSEDAYKMVFQSRFGAARWLQPYCAETLQTLPDQGIQKLDIICPGFAVDCLETLEEIALQNRELFLAAGGKQYRYIHCLNDNASHAHLLKELVLCDA